MTVTTNYVVSGNGITGSTAEAVQSLVSGGGNGYRTALTVDVGLLRLQETE